LLLAGAVLATMPAPWPPLQFTILALGLVGSLYTVQRIAHRRYQTRARRIWTQDPFTILIVVLGALNVVMFMFPMAHRM
jgi:hypothetical protein